MSGSFKEEIPEKKAKGSGLYDLIYLHITICVGWDDGVGGVWWLVAVTSLSAHTVPVPSQACHTASHQEWPGQCHHCSALGSQHSTANFGSLFPSGLSRNISFFMIYLFYVVISR